MCIHFFKCFYESRPIFIFGYAEHIESVGEWLFYIDHCWTHEHIQCRSKAFRSLQMFYIAILRIWHKSFNCAVSISWSSNIVVVRSENMWVHKNTWISTCRLICEDTLSGFWLLIYCCLALNCWQKNTEPKFNLDGYVSVHSSSTIHYLIFYPIIQQRKELNVWWSQVLKKKLSSLFKMPRSWNMPLFFVA